MAFTAARTGSARPVNAPAPIAERELIASRNAAAAAVIDKIDGSKMARPTPTTFNAPTPVPALQARRTTTPIAFPGLDDQPSPSHSPSPTSAGSLNALGQHVSPRVESHPWKLAGANLPSRGLPPRRADSKAGASARFDLPSVPEHPPSPLYTGFAGTPVDDTGFGGTPDSAPHHNSLVGINVDVMEATVASLIAEASGQPAPPQADTLAPVSDWFDVPRSAASSSAQTTLLASGVHSFQMGTEHASRIERALESLVLNEVTSRSSSATEHRRILHALRADSAGAPSGHKQVVAWGEPWPSAELKEMGNHKGNGTWRHVTKQEIPGDRRIHRLLWVYKLKRDGSAKARLCVDGSSMRGNGIDYNQTFSDALKYESARSLFAMSARFGCKVRSIDLVAAYLQGDMLEGESVFCYPPAGHETYDKDNNPLYCEIVKPVYGMPQAGRRLQRKLYPWLESVGLRRLDDSDGNVFVYDDPSGKETFVLGCYVDNFQIVHSVDVNEKGKPADDSSFYAKFRNQLLRDWDVLDEGPMTDLLGIEVIYHSNGSVTLHQNSYITKRCSRDTSPRALLITSRRTTSRSPSISKPASSRPSKAPPRARQPFLTSSGRSRSGWAPACTCAAACVATSPSRCTASRRLCRARPPSSWTRSTTSSCT